MLLIRIIVIIVNITPLVNLDSIFYMSLSILCPQVYFVNMMLHRIIIMILLNWPTVMSN